MIFFSIAIIGLMFLLMVSRNKEYDLEAKLKIYERKHKEETYYQVRRYRYPFDEYYSKEYFETIEEAESFSIKTITNKHKGIYKEYKDYVEFEKSEVWFKNTLIKTNIANNQIPIDKIVGFDFKNYNGNIKNNSNFDTKNILHFKQLQFKLTNGEDVYLKDVQYSLQENSFIGQTINEIDAKTKKIPVQIIQNYIGIN
jgi:hypothetical protein